jgi:hypothetical protein
MSLTCACNTAAAFLPNSACSVMYLSILCLLLRVHVMNKMQKGMHEMVSIKNPLNYTCIRMFVCVLTIHATYIHLGIQCAAAIEVCLSYVYNMLPLVTCYTYLCRVICYSSVLFDV